MQLPKLVINNIVLLYRFGVMEIAKSHLFKDLDRGDPFRISRRNWYLQKPESSCSPSVKKSNKRTDS